MGRGLGVLVGNEKVTMLGLARILGLIVVRLRGIRTPALLDNTDMLRTSAVAHTITHGMSLACVTDNGKEIQGKKVSFVT
jgi:hypothetical protein